MAKRPKPQRKPLQSAKRGPKEERLVITSDPSEALRKLLTTKKTK